MHKGKQLIVTESEWNRRVKAGVSFQRGGESYEKEDKGSLSSQP